MVKESRINKYMLLAILSNLIGAMNLNLNKFFARDLGVETSALLFGIRYIVAGLIMILLYRQTDSDSDTPKSNLKTIKDKPILLIHLVLIGVLIVTAFRFFNNTALLTVNSDLAAVSEQLQGLFNIAIMAIISKNYMSKVDARSTLAYIAGALILVIGAGIFKADLVGLANLLLSVFLLALGDIYIKHIHEKYGMSIKFIRGITGITGGLPMLFGKTDLSLIHPKHLVILAVVVLSTIVLQIFWSVSMEHLQAYQVNMTKVALAIGSTFIGFIFYGELPATTTIIGCVIITYAVVLQGNTKAEDSHS